MDRRGRGVRATLVVHFADPPCGPNGRAGAGEGHSQSDRCLCRRATGSKWTHAGRGSRPAHLDPSGDARPDRDRADVSGRRSVCCGQGTRGLRARGGSAVREPPLWRTPRALLARLRALRGHARYPLRQLPGDLAVSRLRDRCIQHEQTLRHVCARATRRRFVAGPHARPIGGDGFRALQSHDQRGWHDYRGSLCEPNPRSRGGVWSDLSRADHGLCRLPRPQVRPVFAKGPLWSGRVSGEHAGETMGSQYRGAVPGAAAAEAGNEGGGGVRARPEGGLAGKTGGPARAVARTHGGLARGRQPAEAGRCDRARAASPPRRGAGRCAKKFRPQSESGRV